MKKTESSIPNLSPTPGDKPVVTGCSVLFYDCQMAMKDRDYSGSDLKHYTIGKVIDVYDYTSCFGYTDRVCDIEVGERVSRAHFVRGVKVVNN
jgi:hypothetical protein